MSEFTFDNNLIIILFSLVYRFTVNIQDNLNLKYNRSSKISFVSLLARKLWKLDY